jgi:hypothetical protein
LDFRLAHFDWRRLLPELDGAIRFGRAGVADIQSAPNWLSKDSGSLWLSCSRFFTLVLLQSVDRFAKKSEKRVKWREKVPKCTTFFSSQLALAKMVDNSRKKDKTIRRVFLSRLNADVGRKACAKTNWRFVGHLSTLTADDFDGIKFEGWRSFHCDLGVQQQD